MPADQFADTVSTQNKENLITWKAKSLHSKSVWPTRT